MKKIIKIIVILLFLACSKDKNNIDKVNQQKFIKVYTELIKLGEHIPRHSPEYGDSAKKIFNKYNFSKQDYKSSLSYYNQNPKRWENFFQTVYDTLDTINPDKSNIQ